MNKTLAILVVIFVFRLGFAANSHAGSSIAIGGVTEYASTKLVGSMVTTLDGEELGRILDLEVDSQGHVVFALIAQNGFDEFPGRVVVVPFSALTIAETKSQPILIVLNVDKEKFYTAPTFDTNDLENPQWVTGLYRFFGEQPYWTEGAVEKAVPSPAQNLCSYPYSLLK